ncbi:NAD(P)/FAD-dependent oxidoreductase [Pseudoduganella namucuonensis]|uniref:NADH dehydrogenase n=1 Tax=Pseudoduganella namucuonensis TaxID=1035707 RepID=A0A1I7JDL2_9BURK|nr:NAD(P)/FAD-dependent oxidoreductase [Pseudoduganella namucuonensis]SFU83285.1 NADH dehydrogenase [Pseudoduganella namucuonensis]
MQTIVIVGGGAGGLELATRLGDTMGRKGRARVILVDRSPTHFWKPLLHTVASGKRDPQVFQIEYSAQAAQHGFTFIHAELRSVDRADKSLELAPILSDDMGEAPSRKLGYSTLVLALGAVTNFYGVPGAADNVCTLDSVRDAKAFYRRFFGACVRASEEEGRQVNVVIVGGGATGVELAAELVYSARALAKYKAHSLDPARDVRISVLERGERLLPHLPAELSARAEAYLRSRGIEICTGTAVKSVEADTVHVAEGAGEASARPATLTLWAAGVEGPAICTTLGLQLSRMRQIMVNASLQSIDDASVFAIGDCASFVCPVKGAAPPRAQVAHQQAVFLAAALARREGKPLPEFSYRDYGSLVSLGPVAAIGVLLGGSIGRQLPVSGTMAQVLYGLMYQKHLMALHGFVRAAAVTLSDWLRKRLTPSVKLH